MGRRVPPPPPPPPPPSDPGRAVSAGGRGAAERRLTLVGKFNQAGAYDEGLYDMPPPAVPEPDPLEGSGAILWLALAVVAWVVVGGCYLAGYL